MQNYTLSAVISPSNADDKAVAWSSSDINIVSVDNSGNITAVAPGTAVVSATSKDNPTKTAQCTVTVRNIEITGLRLFKADKEINDEFTLSTEFTTSPSVNNLLYQVWVEDGNEWRMVKNFNDGCIISSCSANTTTTRYEFTIPSDSLTKDFSYKVHVRIKDSVTDTIYDQETETATCVDSQQLTIDKLRTSAAVEDQCSVGDNLTITAFGTNIDQYEFSVSSGSSWTIIRPFDALNSCTWTPTFDQIGNIILKVTAKDVNGGQMSNLA